MASQLGYLETEEAIIKNICLPNRCVYARSDGRCSTKYSDEAIIDFAGDGCQTAATRDPSDTGLVDIDNMCIIPGTMTAKGFTPFQEKPITRREHQTSLINVEGKIIYPSGGE